MNNKTIKKKTREENSKERLRNPRILEWEFGSKFMNIRKIQ
jgi:hypothetical protein